MPILSNRLFQSLSKSYRDLYNLPLRLTTVDGQIQQPDPVRATENLAALCRARAHSLQESVRWGEAQAFFVAPGVMTWIIPLMNQSELKGGLCGGYVFIEDDPQNEIVALNYLISEGATRSDAVAFTSDIPLFEQKHIRTAADKLYELFYEQSGWNPRELHRNRDQMNQQRQIAEEIHQRKVEQNRAYPYDEERILLSHIRVGDRAGARKIFNKMLAAMFLYSPKPVVVRARAIEMMGYLVRTAVEDSPMMEPLLERHMDWIVKIVETQGFEDLCNVLREALDDFMNSIYLQGRNATSPAVSRALDFIAANFTETISLDAIAEAAGLSTFRIAHLLKESTGKTALQNIHYLRIQEARRLLETSDMSCTDIAYETGFGDQSYFIKQFRKWMGVTPAKYRKSFQS